MSETTAFKLLERIAEYAQEGPFIVALHGGEPTLWPLSHFRALADRVLRLRELGHPLEVSLQTNLYRPLSRELISLLRSIGVKIGISIDGPPQWNDRHRVNHAGAGSSAAIGRNLRAMIEAGDDDIIGGFLSVADPQIPPGEYLEWVRSLPLTKLDVLWPIQFNQDSPPWGPTGERAYADRPLYGSWMADLFERWWELDDPSIHIRGFVQCVELLLGSSQHCDYLVNDHLDMLVVNTDGRIEYPDYLRATAAGSRPTGLNIFDHSLERISRDPVFQDLFNLGRLLPDECRSCRHKDVCGGGFLAGRTSSADLVAARPSVLCADQKLFFDTVQRCVRQQCAMAYA